VTATAQRVLVVASHPQHCAVCHDEREVNALVLGHPLDYGPAPCPHCGPERLPVVHLPARRDLPRKAST
jgi:hypothetical protein